MRHLAQARLDAAFEREIGAAIEDIVGHGEDDAGVLVAAGAAEDLVLVIALDVERDLGEEVAALAGELAQ